MSLWLKNFISGLLAFFQLFTIVSGIDCYKCSSHNFSDPFCHDPFHPAYKNVTVDCGEGRDGRVGLFPARYCTKITGVNSEDGTEKIIRSCSIESLDTICGQFNLENVLYSGCITSCETDACNSSRRSSTPEMIHYVTAAVFLLVNLWW